MTCPKRTFVLLALVVAAWASSGCTVLQPTPRIERVVVFGDSNVDNGNLFRMSASKVPAPPNWQGRNGNGPVVVEHLAEILGARLESHAVSGATTGTTNIVSRSRPEFAHLERSGMSMQIDSAITNGLRFSQLDLVVVWAGSNDIFGASRQKEAELRSAISTAANNVEDAIVRLNKLGAVRFVVGNRTPRERLGTENDLNGVDLNKSLAEAVARARGKTSASVKLFDAYSAVADMMTRPNQYGFTEVSTLCISVPACANDSSTLSYPVARTYVNWDAAHKTTHVHKLLAEQIEQILQR